MEVVSVIATIGGYFVDPIKKHCGYLFHYNSNIKDRDDKIQKLRDKKVGTEIEIDEDRRNGQVITCEAETWIEQVRNILGEDDEGLNGWCPRYSLSGGAKKKTLKIDGLLEDRKSLKISNPPPPAGMKPLPVKDIKDFESRTNKMNEVLEALRDDKVNMIAICGMGGIGKTSMAKVVANRAKFDEVAFAVVSQNKDERKIQDEIARMLGLKLDEKDSLLGRAGRLKSRLMDDKSKLVILDDVWDALDLVAVGIPYGGEHNRCKILLTS